MEPIGSIGKMYYTTNGPIDHKNMARFVTPQVKSNHIFNQFKALGGEAEATMTALINNLNQQQQSHQIANKVQKLDPSLEPAKSRPQSNGNGLNYVAQTNGNGFGGVLPSIKTESDSNESSNHSDGRGNLNGINNLNGIDNINFAHFSNFHLNRIAGHHSPVDQSNAGPLKSLDQGACISMNLLDTLNGSTPNSLTTLNNLNSLNQFNVNNFAYLNNGGLTGGNVINSSLNTKPPESSGKRTSSGRKPTNSKEEQLSPEEDEKRKQRRERNKEAAARCRKRRVEQTKTLEDETKNLQEQKDLLSREIQYLRTESEKLMHILAGHDCKLSVKNH